MQNSLLAIKFHTNIINITFLCIAVTSNAKDEKKETF